MLKLVMRSHRLVLLICLFACAPSGARAQGEVVEVQPATAQQAPRPITNEEFLRLLRQLPSRPDLRDELVEEIRRRGISFPLTPGLRSLVATKSGNDSLLRRTLDEAERRRLNPAAAALPSEREALELLERAREATLAAAEAMPDFVVKQQVVRSAARGLTKNWSVLDRLTVAVSYRDGEGEKYRVLAVNGMPSGTESEEKGDYAGLGGTSSTGEYVTRLALLFTPASRAEFRMVDTDLLRGRRTVVYEFEVLKKNWKAVITHNNERSVAVGARGRVWIDRESSRVLRLESIATEIEPGFPVTASANTIDYDWVTIADRQYLLPSRAVLEMTGAYAGHTLQTRNDIRFRNYQKYGSEVKVLEEDIIDEEAPEKKP